MLAAPQGFEPRYADPESAVLPLNEGAVFLTGAGIPAASIVWSSQRCGQPCGIRIPPARAQDWNVRFSSL